MAIISAIGRKSPGVRALHAAIYAALLLGAVSMLYPFLIMVAGSTKSGADQKSFQLIPAFLRDDAWLYRKHVEGLFNERLADLQVCYDLDTPSFEHAELPPPAPPGLVEAWARFLAETNLPDYAFGVGYMHAPVSRTMPSGLRAFKAACLAQYLHDITALNHALGVGFVNWNAFTVRPKDFLNRRARITGSAWEQTFHAFARQRPPGEKYYFMAEGYFKALFLKAQYTRDIRVYNEEHGTAHASYDEVRLSRTVPSGTARERDDWEAFVRDTLNLLWVRVDQADLPQYRAYLQAKYGDLATLNQRYGTRYPSFAAIAMPAADELSGLPLSDWDNYIDGWIDPDTGRSFQPAVENLRVDSVEFRFRDYLRSRYASVPAMNQDWGASYTSFDQVYPPQRAFHARYFHDQRSALRLEFATRNYRAVLDYLVWHGRGLVNTVVYCALAIVMALLVNPLAAYAMSRYQLPSTYKILLFMLLTMAFPPMVTQLPNFLMLRDLQLLNTFAALVLPAMANGYSVFLLKGFFDSLPRELYESASLDGAGEWTMFWRITMNLSRPILAVIALHAFNAAYANFMFALLICQDESMWTLMVWLYQLQSRSGPGVVYASLIIAALPTFLVFFICQNIIMRGLVVPSEK